MGKEPELLSEIPESYSWAHLRAQPAFWKHCPGDGAGFIGKSQGSVYLCPPSSVHWGFPSGQKGCFPTPLAHGEWVLAIILC